MRIHFLVLQIDVYLDGGPQDFDRKHLGCQCTYIGITIQVIDT